MKDILDFAKEVTREAIEPGALAIDATSGNGHDTEWLAREVGPDGHVVAVDVQEAAIQRTRERLQSADLDRRVTLVQGSHARLRTFIRDQEEDAVDVVMFNLGYLPGSDHFVTTERDTTLQALDAAFELLRLGGVISVVMYTGHPGGRGEAEAVLEWGQRLNQQSADVIHYRFVNRVNDPPELLAVQKRRG